MNIVDYFFSIVKVDSPTGAESAMAHMLVKTLNQLNYKPRIDGEGNVIVQTEGNPSLEPYLLNAHIDTVEPGRGIVPYIADDGVIRSQGNTILGADNKTGVAAIVWALSKIDQLNVRPLDVVFTVSEESGNHGAHGLDYRAIRAKRGYIFDAGGRTCGDIIVSSPFYNRFDITIHGKPAHASQPEEAKNILPVFVDAFSSLKIGRMESGALVNIGIIQGGSAVNTVPGTLTISGEVRSRNETEIEEETNKIVSSFENAAQNAGIHVTASVVRENDGYSFDQSDPFLDRTIHIVESITKRRPVCIDSWGCYEANIFSAHGVKVLNIADGSLKNHTANEEISTKDLQTLGEIVLTLTTKT